MCTNITKNMHEYNSLYLCILHIYPYVCLYMHVLEIHKEAQCMYLYVPVCIYLYMSVYDCVYLYHTLEYGSDQLIYCFNSRQPGSLWAKSWPMS